VKRLLSRPLFRTVAIMLWSAAAFSFGGHAVPFTASTLNGVVTNPVTGAGITGAMITVNGATAWSVSGGVYSLTIDPPGTYSVSCSKAGYDPFVSAPVLFQQGGTVVLNIQLEETANAPVNTIAVLDTALQTVHVNWQPPEGNYEILYDDGIQDNFSVWALQGNLNGVKFTPQAWPVKVKGGSINLGTNGNYPPGSNPLVPFQVAVFNASGFGGMPGTLIGGPFDVLPLHLGWVGFTFPNEVQVNAGNFYLVMIQGGNAPNAAGVAVDETFPQFRSVQRFITGGGPWIPAGGNFMIRALVDGAGGPAGLTDNGDALTGYQVWRLRQGEEQNPAVWTDLGATSDPNINDPGWFTFPCGPYIWGVKAQFTGNRWSPVSFSDVVPKCWTAGFTVETQLTCTGGDKSGTGVRLQNLVYPDTIYNTTLDTSGTYLFPEVWKGTYELKLLKFGYQEQVLTVPVSHDTTIAALLLQKQSPPRDLEVNEKTLVAHWRVPQYTEELFSEDWSSAAFTTNGWTTEGGYNWVISTINGNPEPSAMFGWSPQVSNYSQTLTSPQIDTRHAPVLILKYDIFLDDFGTTTLNQMAVEAWDGTIWTSVDSYNNSAGDIPWTAGENDLSAWSGTPLRVRFHATGGESYDINGWNIDNIRIEGSETQSGLTNCVLGYNVYLDNVQSGFTTDTKYSIPGNQVQYGQNYNICVNAAYGSGWSDNVCVPFTSGFLWPPRDLNAEVIENAVELTWEKPQMPDTAGQMVTPPGLTGYRIYRNLQLIDSVSGPDTLNYYDLQMEPGNYDYEVTARYDLTDYGSPGQFDESMAAGPVTVQINFGRLLPFFEPWDQASFSFNDWQFDPGQGNWFINTASGDPLPSAEFDWEPVLTDYKHALVSPPLDGTSYQCGKIYLDFDLTMDLMTPTGNENLTADIYYNDEWHRVASFRNDSAIDWLHRSIDISEVAGKGFMVRFSASGSNSSDILYWQVDNINVYAVCFGPSGLQADVQGYDVHLSWMPPDCTGPNMYLDEGFEGELFPPASWSQVTADPGSAWSKMDPLSPVGVHSGNFSAGVLWDYVHQDEWLIAENVIVNGNLEFWSFAFQGSVHLDHYYVKVSTDEGFTWDVLLDLSALPPYPSPGGYNQWMEPYMIDLSAYIGEVVSVAWQAVDGDGQGLWYSWGIDDCRIGSKKLDPVSVPVHRKAVTGSAPDNLLGYDIYRREYGSMDFLKVNMNTVSDTFYTDPGLGAGQYEYFINPVFTECNVSETSDTVIVDVITGIRTEDPGQWRIWPVPAMDRINVETPEKALSFEIISAGGTVLYHSEPAGLKCTIDVSAFPPGVYVMRMISLTGCRNRMFIVSR
jgi:hypothetical protein